MKIKMIETMLETIDMLDETEQLKIYKTIVSKILAEQNEISQKRAEARKGKTKTKETETKQTTEIKEKKEKKQPDPEVTECMGIVKQYNGWTIEGAEWTQRKYAKLLIDKMKKIESIQNWKTTRQEVLNIILNIVSNNKYHATKIASPEKIYYNLSTLMQVCKQEGTNRTFDINSYSLPWINW